MQTQFKAHPLVNPCTVSGTAPHNLYKSPNKMNVPSVEEEDVYRSSHQPNAGAFVSLENILGSVLIEVLLTEAVMKQREPFNLFIYLSYKLLLQGR